MDYFINIDSICDVDKTQIREGYDNGVIADLSLMFADGNEYPDELPPMTVTQKPGDDFHYWLVDGHHRFKAAKNTGVTKLKVKILDEGEVKDLDDLRFLQSAENAEAVANRTVETRRRQVKAAIKKRPDWRTFQIARYCHVSYDLVNSVWAELEAQDEAQKPKKPIEKAAEAISKPENAGKSNRQIAKETGLAEQTVRRAKQEAEMRQNSERKIDAPSESDNYPAGYVPDYQCPNCGNDNSGELCFDWNGKKLYFCCYDCIEEYAAENDLEVDHVNHMFIENDFDAQLEKVASNARERDAVEINLDKAAAKAAESLKAAGFVEVHPDSIPIRDNANIEWIVDDVLDWLKDRADVFAVLLRDRIENGN